MSVPQVIPIDGCDVVPVSPNRDARGCLYEIFRECWPHSFRTVQWNACVSNRGVVRGVHVHVDYDEYYTLPLGRVLLGLHDIRRSSSTFGRTAQLEWSQHDACAVVVPKGVAHLVYFCEDSVLAFGLSDFWKAEYDVIGCEWDDAALGFKLPVGALVRSARDASSGSYDSMVRAFEEMTNRWHDARRGGDAVTALGG
jgi:dTDP-4-dehydrorhamnose 3,5-epimerase